MDNRDSSKNQTSGNDSHGVHVCYKCGWPFPNPHPSARHRRAHKKICGTVEGYKLVDSQGSAYSVLSDDEHPSDEDNHKTPSPLVVQRSFDEKKSAGSGERTSRSEDDAFVDAVTEFSDSGSGPSGKGIEDSSDVAKKQARSIEATLDNDAKTVLSFEDDAITALVPPSSNSADSSQDTEIQGNNLSADALASGNQSSHVTAGSVGTTDCRTENSGHESIDKKQCSTSELNPFQLENQADVSQENMKKRAREELAVTDVMGNKDQNKKRNAVGDLIEVDIKENEKAHLDRLLLDFDTTSHNAIQTSEAVSTLGKTEDVTSDYVTAAGVIELKEQCGEDLDSKRSLNVPSSEVDVFKSANNYFSSNQINVSATGEMDSASSGKLTEIANEGGEVNDNFHVFSIPGHIPVLKNPEIMIEGYKDHEAGRMPQFVDVDSFKDSAHKFNPSNSFSSLSYEGEQLFASGSHISVDNIQQEGGNSELVKDSVQKVSPTNSFSSISDEGEQLFASDTHFSVDSILLEGRNRENVAERFRDETELGGPQLKEAVNHDQVTDESCARKDAAGDEVEKSSTVQCPQEQLPDDSHHNLSGSISSEHGTGSISALVDAEVEQASNLIGTDNDADYEISGFDTTKSEEVKGIAEDSSGKIMVTPENLGILSEGKVESISSEHGTGSISDATPVDVLVDAEVRQASNLVGTDDAADYEISGFDTTKSEEVKGVAEDSSGKITATPENLGILSEGKVESISSEHGTGSISDTTPVDVLVDAEVGQASNLVGTDDAADYEISGFDTTKSEEVKGVAEDSSGKITATPENLGILSEGKVESISSEHGTGSISDTTPVDVLVDAEVGQASNLVGTDNDADYEISGFDTTKSEEVKGVAEDGSGKIMVTPENLGILSEGKVESISSEHGMGSISDANPVDVLVDAEVRQASNLVGTDDAADYEISEFDTTKSEEVKGIAEDSSGKITATPENLGILSEGIVHEGNDFSGGQNTSDNGIVKGENSYGSKFETRKGDSSLGLVDGSAVMNTTMTPEIAKDLHETLVTSKNVDNASEINVSKPECLLLNKASYNQVSVLEGETNDKVKVLVEDCTAGESDNVGDDDELHKSLNTAGDVEISQMPSDKVDDFEALQKSPKEHITKESQLSPSNASSSVHNRATVGDNPASDFVETARESQSASCPDEGENKIIAQQLGASAADLSVDSGSQTDSLEGHWGSVSVLSTQSDMQATVDNEPSAYGSKASAEAEKVDLKKSETSMEGAQETDRSDMFEPPSFMTLVEPRDGDKVAAADDDIQTAQNLQQPKESQAGWFPSLTNVVNESQGRKKNEEIIAKVTNWSTPKQHAPLKNLLGEANMENKSKLSNPKDNQPPPVVQKDEPKPTVIGARDNSVAAAISNPTSSPQKSLPETVKKDDTGKEWNSPARYPADIKREKRKVKGKPYWAQFMCCSSVN